MRYFEIPNIHFSIQINICSSFSRLVKYIPKCIDTQDIIAFSGLADSIDRPMSTYSSGMTARLKFAIASSVEHDILLLDEALATGDMEFKESSIARMQELRARAEAVILVSHSMSSIRASCSRVVRIEKGAVRADGPPEETIDLYVVENKRRRHKQGNSRP